MINLDVHSHDFLTQLQPVRLLTKCGPYWVSKSTLKLHFEWFKRTDLHELDIRPSLLAEAFAVPELAVRHIVHHESE